jgi:hypothetical protein
MRPASPLSKPSQKPAGWNRVSAAMQPFRRWEERHRRFVLTTAILVFVIMLVWSFCALDLAIWKLRPLPFLLLFCILSPLSVVYGAQGIGLLARVVGKKMPFSTAFRASAVGQIAEILPLPGGAIVRTIALTRVGARPVESAVLVTATALLWISLAAVGAGVVIMWDSHAAGVLFAVLGLLCSSAILGWIGWLANLRVMVFTLLHRLAGLVLTALRLSLSFAIIGVAVSPQDTMPFVLASIAGSAASIAPAGLGVSELLAALMANGLGSATAAAILAVALNRLIGLASTILLVVVMDGPSVLRTVPPDER